MGLDWTIDIGEARRRVGDKVTLQGNIDPNVLFGSQETIASEAKKVLDSFGTGNTGQSAVSNGGATLDTEAVTPTAATAGAANGSGGGGGGWRAAARLAAARPSPVVSPVPRARPLVSVEPSAYTLPVFSYAVSALSY